MTDEKLDLIIELIEKGKLRKGLEALSPLVGNNNTLRKVHIHISSQLEEAKRNYRKGIISYSEYQQDRNRQIDSILYLVEQIRNPRKKHDIHEAGASCFLVVFDIVFSSVIAIGVIAMIIILAYNLPDLIESRKQRLEQTKKNKEQIRKIDSINLATKKYIDSINSSESNLPKPEIEERVFEGIDKNEFRAEYIIYIIRGFNWRLGEVAVGEDNGKKFDICDYLSLSGINSRLNEKKLKAITCFGNASHEEDSEIPENMRLKEEESKAEKRAKKLADCVNYNLKKLTPVYTLNLGKHLKEVTFSEWQRQIVIIGLVKKDSDVIEGEAIYNGLVREHVMGNIEFNIMDYSLVDNEAKLLKMSRRFN